MRTSLVIEPEALQLTGRFSVKPCIINGARIQRRAGKSYRALTSKSTTSRIIKCSVASDSPPSSQKRHKSKKDQLPPLPQATKHQQTVRRSFTIGGVGLHTGQYAYVRVRPAPAGTGRYFIRVPNGTNEDQYIVDQPQTVKEEDLELGAVIRSPEQEEEQTQAFMEYLQAREYDDYDGTFGEFVQEKLGDPHEDDMITTQYLPDEEAKVFNDSSNWIPASISSVTEDEDLFRKWLTPLNGPNGDQILGTESLLATLEACGVDNARIEIEGGDEVPVIDGSSLGWALEIQRVGLQECEDPSGGGRSHTHRTAPAPRELVTVCDGDAFITFYPGGTPRVTAGVEYDVPCLASRQWFSWSPEKDGHYRWEVAPAHTTLPSLEVVEDLVGQGLLRAGPDHCCLVGYKEKDWVDDSYLRFPENEAARNAVNVLLGHLSLLAQPGGRGLPQGHVVAYRASHDLMAKFAKMIQVHCYEGWYENL